MLQSTVQKDAMVLAASRPRPPDLALARTSAIDCEYHQPDEVRDCDRNENVGAVVLGVVAGAWDASLVSRCRRMSMRQGESSATRLRPLYSASGWARSSVHWTAPQAEHDAVERDCRPLMHTTWSFDDR